MIGDPSQDSLLVEFSVPVTYAVRFTEGVFHPHNSLLGEVLASPVGAARALVVIDEGVVRATPGLLESVQEHARAGVGWSLAGSPRVVPGGEAAKNDPGLVSSVYRDIARQGIDRHSYVVVVGGGAVQDAVGFAAATAHRGVRVVRIPTTVLSQNDSGVGVKNGVNFSGLKNFVGSFAPPHAVINDSLWLRTLPLRDRRAGLAEAVKVALVRDAKFYAWLEQQAEALARFEHAATQRMIFRSAQLHVQHIAGGGDPFERGSQRPLDFGHWAAHKLESLTQHRLRHGEAVAIGMALDVQYSLEVGLLSRAWAERIHQLLARLGFQLWDEAMDAPTVPGRHPIFEGLQEFREHLGGQLTISLLREPGRPQDVHEVSEEKMLQALSYLRARYAPSSNTASSPQSPSTAPSREPASSEPKTEPASTAPLRPEPYL